MIPYNKQSIDQSDIDAVTNCLLSDYLTTGPLVEQFEHAICNYTGARYCAVVSSGTAAIQCALFAAGVGPGDEVILPDMTFVGVANCIVNLGATPVFCDVFEDTMLINYNKLYSLITPKTKAIIGMDYTGVPADYRSIREAVMESSNRKIVIIADAAHSFGAMDHGIKVGVLADITCFSFHPVKTITSAEGGAVVSNNETCDKIVKRYRNHGINKDIGQRTREGDRTSYAVSFPGYNFRLSDIHCALGISQLSKVDGFLSERLDAVELYKSYLKDYTYFKLLPARDSVYSANHLVVGKLNSKKPRLKIIKEMEELGVQLGVHYPSITRYMLQYGRYNYSYPSTQPNCPVSNAESGKLISLPLFVGITQQQIEEVCTKLNDVLSK